MEEKEAVKVNRKEIFRKKALASYLQISILIISSFAFAYLIDVASRELGKQEVQKEGKIAIIFNFIWKQLTKEIFPTVSAETMNCCPQSKNGAICQEYISSQCSANCLSGCVQTSCSQLASCKSGCCFDPTEGICSANSPKQKCETDGGIWKDSATCNVNTVPECKLGCCVLKDNTVFTTETRCEKLTSESQVNLDFRAGITTEFDCLALSFSQDRGACLFDNQGCKFVTGGTCVSLKGKSFFKDTLCTAEALNTTCKPTSNTACVDGRDEVYFLDSCGNVANIYDSSKINDKAYWTKVVVKENSCGATSSNGNANSASCGNCDYGEGSKCKSVSGKNTCADVSCKSAIDNNGNRKDRKNGESWCVFDGAIGGGKDLVGSRYYRYSCIDGEVKSEPCADFRNEICIQKDIGSGADKISTASCRINQWQTCLDGTGCGKTPDCFTKTLKLSSNIDAFNVCLPNYPPGFETKTEEGSKAAGVLCSQVYFKCTVVYQKKLFSGWKCKANCDCEKASFTEQMHQWCASIGDCGFKKNVAGQETKNFAVTGGKKRVGDSTTSIGSLAWEGNYPEPGNPESITGEGNPASTPSGETPEEKQKDISMMIAFIPGALGFLMTATGGANAPLVTAAGVTAAGFGNALVGAGIGAGIGILLAKLFKLEGGSATIMALAGGIIAFVIMSQGGWQLGALFSWAGLIGLVILIVIAFILSILGVGKTKKYVVEFKCLPWTAPLGGADCEKCNNKEKPCSKYRCQSLGQACIFLNEGSNNELCISAVDDKTAPVIEPWREILNGNFSYANVTNKGFSIRQADGKCIEAFTPLLFGIKTNEASQCKLDVVHTVSYDSMEQYFGDDNLFIYNHSMGFSMPSIESLVSEIDESNITYQYVLNKVGSTRFYIRCQDAFGNFNPSEYLIDICVRAGPDKTPPYITKTIPDNNAFIAYNKTEQDTSVYLNEPSTCKYSKNDKSYALMENSFSCETDLADVGVFGWLCNTTLTNLTRGENKFYIRCKDQPWLTGANESKRNENTASYVYKLRLTENPLTITSILPNGSSSFGTEPI